jgi:type I restriction enzyme S subunit
MEAREGYKKTELGWIPASWDVVQIGSFTKPISQKNTSCRVSQVVSVTKYNGIVNSLSYFNKQVYSKDLSTYKIIRRNQFAYATIHLDEGSIGILTSHDKAVLSPMYTVFEADKGLVDIYFLLCVLKSKRLMDLYQHIGSGSINRRKTISYSTFGKIDVLLPPLPEQQKIAEILTTVDDKISSIEDRIQQTEQLKKGLMEKLLTEGIGHTEFKDTEIGRMPASWDVVQIKEIGNVITGNTPPTSNKLNYNNGIRLWASPADLGLFKYVKETKTKVSASGFEQTRKLPKNSLLITCIGSTIGKIGIAFEEMSSNQQINAIVCKDNHYDCDFYYYVISRISPKIKQLSATQAVPIINKTEFSNIIIPKAPFPEQNQIATILSTVDDKLDILQSKKSSYETLKKGLMEQLLTGKIRVKV